MFDGNSPVKSSWSRFSLRTYLLTCFFTLYICIKMFYFFCVNAFLETDFICIAKFVVGVVHNITLSFLKFQVGHGRIQNHICQCLELVFFPTHVHIQVFLWNLFTLWQLSIQSHINCVLFLVSLLLFSSRHTLHFLHIHVQTLIEDV